MNYARKLARKANLHARRSDRRNLGYAVLAALGAEILFWSVFSYHDIPRQPSHEHASPAVTMLSREDAEEFATWVKYHDPVAFHRGDYRKFVTGAARSGADIPASVARRRPMPVIPVTRAAVGKYQEFQPPEYQPPAVLPLPPPAASPPPAPRRSGAVTDGAGKPLAVGDVVLPARTPAARHGRTVLRVLDPGRFPTPVVARSCGDFKLDLRAQQLLLPLTMSGGVLPEIVVVEWPEKAATGEVLP